MAMNCAVLVTDPGSGTGGSSGGSSGTGRPSAAQASFHSSRMARIVPSPPQAAAKALTVRQVGSFSPLAAAL